jgi:hypothetical protein
VAQRLAEAVARFEEVFVPQKRKVQAIQFRRRLRLRAIQAPKRSVPGRPSCWARGHQRSVRRLALFGVRVVAVYTFEIIILLAILDEHGGMTVSTGPRWVDRMPMPGLPPSLAAVRCPQGRVRRNFQRLRHDATVTQSRQRDDEIPMMPDSLRAAHKAPYRACRREGDRGI